ncbi:winged helix-turn-helix transcriptional regulator [Methylovulum miyakonense]|uniref:winged helix-turn-helix transcriptional regulator n=1 Tax=Methylovulum miyakonense TaxID=645578 RepID=UPI00036229FF|nr:helix-turn-helix domain-containing protein [Methylovulum miyakonense]
MKETAKFAASKAGTNVEFKTKTALNVAETIEAIFGCKWSLRILALIREGINRPTAIERALEGLTPKVQNYYFRRMMVLGILERVVFAEVPPRVEYHLTSFGERLLPLLDAILALQRELEAEVDGD